MTIALLTALIVLVSGAALQPRAGRQPAPPATPARPHDGHRRAMPHLPSRHQQVADPADLARWLGDISSATRSGTTISAALRAAARPLHVDGDLDHIILMLDRGTPLVDALAAPAESTPDSRSTPDFGLALTVLRACAAHGGAPAQALDRAAATLRARAADNAERTTQSAQARLSAVVMTWLPVAMLVVLIATSGPVRRVLISPIGLVIVAVGVGLNAIGWRWMRRIVDGRSR